MQPQQQTGTTATDEAVPVDAELRAVWRQRLVDELTTIAEHARERPTADLRLDEPEKVDVADQQTLEIERDLEQILDDGSGAAADAIRAAIRRLDDGTFGSCVDCGETIAIARLMALPYAARCLDCQTRSERRR